jgi:sugar lactone lactonase YvrE
MQARLAFVFQCTLAALSTAAIASADLFAGMAAGSPANPGAVATLDPTTFAGTVLGTPVAGLSGVAFTPDGRLWGSTRTGGGTGTGSDLAEIDPATGALISQTAISDGVVAVRIADLSVQPGSGKLFGIGNRVGVGPLGELFTIDTSTALATLVGDTLLGNDGGLAFAPDGTLYLASASVANPFLATLDPTDASVMTSIAYGPDVGMDGLEVRGSDGALLATRGQFAGGDLIVRINPVNGATTQLGSTGVGTPSDIAFRSATVFSYNPAGINLDTLVATPAALGNTWTATVTVSHPCHAGPGAASVLIRGSGFVGGGPIIVISGPPTELLVGPPPLGKLGPLPHGGPGTTVTFSTTVPTDPTLCGLAWFAQSVVSGGCVVLSNGVGGLVGN